MDTKAIGTSVGRTGLNKIHGQKKTGEIDSEVNKASAGSDGMSERDFNVNLSNRAREMAGARNRALNIARNTPDIREDRVAELKEKIQSGAYKIEPEKIVDGMIKEAILDKLATDSE
ncbi:MAG: flagellar biosynthesis anti-sigma factor FlgM [Oligoflexales bacterium]|nr:flagellar biosynthesis anti-sigma factor FlgM [Oligoflexales bacterium]